MDNFQIMELINRCKHLKNLFRGIHPVDFPYSLVVKNDNIMIMNALPSDQPGTHWFLFANVGGQIFFADPIGKRLYDYPLVYKNMRCTIQEGNQLLMKKPIKSADSVLCGLYCIYVAHVTITKRFPIGFNLLILI